MRPESRVLFRNSKCKHLTTTLRSVHGCKAISPALPSSSEETSLKASTTSRRHQNLQNCYRQLPHAWHTTHADTKWQTNAGAWICLKAAGHCLYTPNGRGELALNRNIHDRNFLKGSLPVKKPLRNLGRLAASNSRQGA